MRYISLIPLAVRSTILISSAEAVIAGGALTASLKYPSPLFSQIVSVVF
jgi:hypothetical protein